MRAARIFLGSSPTTPSPIARLFTSRERPSAAQGLIAIYQRNVFPQMKVSWGTYPNNIGHTDFPGCFRCHDNQHTSSDAKLIPQDCETCHNLLAMEDPAPKILTDLGVAPGDSGARH